MTAPETSAGSAGVTTREVPRLKARYREEI